jgi:hypothetical protein
MPGCVAVSQTLAKVYRVWLLTPCAAERTSKTLLDKIIWNKDKVDEINMCSFIKTLPLMSINLNERLGSLLSMLPRD